MERRLKLRLFSAWLLTLLSFTVYSQKMTSVRGQVIDAKTKETMPYVNVQFDGTTIGVTSDIEGNFFIETKTPVSKLKVTYVGYKPQTVKIKTGEANRVDIKMEEEAVDLKEVVVTQGRYRNKGNPAVELIKKVIDNKDKNRKEGFTNFSYNKHEKMEFSLNNVTSKMRNNFLFKKIKFVFENVDTNKASGKIHLPVFLRENISDVYYRKDPKAQKEYIRGERITNFDDLLNSIGIAQYMTNMYQEIDFYDNTIMLLTNGFVSPLSPLAPTIYRFYIQDTSIIKGIPMAHMYFAPRNKTDFAFMGHMWVALDSSYAVRKIEVGIPKDINLNWVNELQLSQEFDWVGEGENGQDVLASNSVATDGEQPRSARSDKRGLMLTKDDIFIDFGANKKDSTRSMLGRKTTSYRNYTVNQPLPDSLFKTQAVTLRAADALTKSETYWTDNRHDTLTTVEKGLYKTVDSLNNFKPFKRFMKVARFVFEGYTPVGGFDIGPANTFYSFNQIEGFRGRLGGRTNTKFSQHLMLEGYAAYGFKDDKWKGYAGMRYNFGTGKLMRFPYNQLRLWYQDEIKIPGQDLQFVSEDNFLLSFKRGVNNKMIYTATMGAEYWKEHLGGFSYSIAAKNIRHRPAGALLFDYDFKGERKFKPEITNTELDLMLRYAPNEQFYEGATYRTPILNKYPTFELRYTSGIKGIMYSEYNFNRLQFKSEKVFYLAPFGYSDLIVEAGRTWGQVPYPLLTAHRANQTYAYQMESYNLMNFLEFVSDKYVSVNYYHNFQGVFLGRIPLLKKLKWREVFTFKSLWGGIDAKNLPSNENSLLRFPVDGNGQVLTHSLDKKPYIETSVGISNIFRVIRIDYVRRLNYIDLPNVSKSGIRARVKMEF
jgi:Family of unknown function (DUF5686)/CarboxypepD_reg-like domain